MKKHKKQAEEHDYCGRCDMDFESFDDYTRHKVYVPDVHGKACSACGEEFKSKSGLQRHFELVGYLLVSFDTQYTKQGYKGPQDQSEHRVHWLRRELQCACTLDRAFGICKLFEKAYHWTLRAFQ